MIRRDDVLGAWRLQAYTAESGDDRDEPLGPDPVGLILYTPDGFMSAQLMRRERPAYDRAITGGGSPEQMAAAAGGYLCYSGPFTLDESAGVLEHHVEVSLLPNWVGGIHSRRAQLDGDTLVLSAEVISRRGVSTTHVLVWRRAVAG